MNKPPRTDAHRQRDALLQQFADAGLIPIISTNGGTPYGDIQVAKGPQHGEVVDCWITQNGMRRLHEKCASDNSARLRREMEAMNAAYDGPEAILDAQR